MVLSRAATFGLLAIAALAIVGLGLPFGLFAGHAHNALGAPVAGATGPMRAAVHPAAGSWINITITSTYPATVTPPFLLNYTIGQQGNPIDPAAVYVSLAVWAGPDSGTAPAVEISNASLPVNLGQADYSQMIGYSDLGGNNPLPMSNYTLQAWVNLLPSPFLGNNANGSNAITIPTMIVVNPVAVFATAVPEWSTIPLTVNFNVSVDTANSGITIDAANLSVSVAFAITQGTIIGFTPVFGLPIYAPNIIAMIPLTYSANGAYTANIDAANLSVLNYNNGVLPGQPTAYEVLPTVTVMNSADPNGPVRTVQAQGVTFFTENTPNAEILSPLNSSGTNTVGTNVTITTYYSGDYVKNANVTVTNSNGTIVFSQGVFSAGGGGHPAAVTWVPGSPGNFTIWLTVVSLSAPTLTVSETGIMVAAAHGTGTGGGPTIIYLNNSNTKYQNTTGGGGNILGLGPNVAAAILLVVGLVIGMIVALALGRMMWSSAPMGAPQQWTSSKSSSGGANECSVCHMTFATPQELADHAKQAHGMS